MRLREFIELPLPGGGVFGPVPGLVKLDDVANGQTPFVGRHLGGGGEELVGIREQQGFGLGIGFAVHLNSAEPVCSLGGQSLALRVMLSENCQRLFQQRFRLVQFALFHQRTAQDEKRAAGAWRVAGLATRGGQG